MERIILKWKCEFGGGSSQMPVMLQTRFSFPNSRLCPIQRLSPGPEYPNILFAAVSVSTMLFGLARTFIGSPERSLKLKKLKKFESATSTVFSVNSFSSCSIGISFQRAIRHACSTPGISFMNPEATGADVYGELNSCPDMRPIRLIRYILPESLWNLS